jgi:hypothetical protein
MDPFARKMLFGSFGFAGMMLLMAGVLSVVYFHTHPRCSDQVLSDLRSPDQGWTAAIMQRRCGDDQPFFIHVNLRPAGAPLIRGYFSGQAAEGEIFLSEQDNLDIVPTLRWDSASQLTVVCPDCRAAQIQKRHSSWGAVTVRYEVPVR